MDLDKVATGGLTGGDDGKIKMKDTSVKLAPRVDMNKHTNTATNHTTKTRQEQAPPFFLFTPPPFFFVSERHKVRKLTFPRIILGDKKATNVIMNLTKTNVTTKSDLSVTKLKLSGIFVSGISKF